jgi:hypothetical protein
VLTLRGACAGDRRRLPDNRVKGVTLELKRRGVPAEEAGKQPLTEFKGKYPDWPNLNPIGSFVQRVYDEKAIIPARKAVKSRR